MPRTLTMLSVLAVFFAYVAYSGLSDSEARGIVPANPAERDGYIIGYYLSFLPVVLIPAILVLSPIWGYICYYRVFRRSPFLNKEMIYKIEHEGLSVESASFKQSSGWTIIGKAREGRNGFLLFYGKNTRQYHWLPKSAFAAPDDVEKSREIIREHVRNFRRLG